MSLEELGMALQATREGMDQVFANRQQQEDADAARKKRDNELAMQEREIAFSDMTEQFRVNSIQANSELTQTAARKAKETADSSITSANQTNSALTAEGALAEDMANARSESGAAADVANTESIDRERQREEDQYKQRVIDAEISAGVPRQEALTKANNAWTKRKTNEAVRESNQEVIDQISTDRLNGVQANEAMARKQGAIATRRTAEMQSRMTKMRQNSGFNDLIFEKEFADGILDNTHDAMYMTEAGLGKEALALIDFDTDGTGVGDLTEIGAVGLQMSTVNGEKVMGAIGTDGNPVVDPDTGEPVVFKSSDLIDWADNRARGGKQAIPKETQDAYNRGVKFGKKSETKSETKPLDVGDVNTINETLDKTLSVGWGLDPDEDGNYNMEAIVSAEALDSEVTLTREEVGEDGKITKVKTPIGGNGEVVFGQALEQFEVDMRRYLHTQHGATGSVMGAMTELHDMPTAVRAVYPMIPESLVDTAMKNGVDNAEKQAREAGIKSEGLGTRIYNYMTGGGDYSAQPEAVKQAVQEELLKLMSLTQKRLAN